MTNTTWQLQQTGVPALRECETAEIVRELRLGLLSGSDWARAVGSRDWKPLVAISTFARHCRSVEPEAHPRTKAKLVAVFAALLAALGVGLLL